MASVYDIILQTPAAVTGSDQFKITLSSTAPPVSSTIFIMWIQDDEQLTIST